MAAISQRLFLTLGLFLVAAGCTSEPDLVTESAEDRSGPAESGGSFLDEELVEEPASTDLVDRLSGTVWSVMMIDWLVEDREPAAVVGLVRQVVLDVLVVIRRVRVCGVAGLEERCVEI